MEISDDTYITEPIQKSKQLDPSLTQTQVIFMVEKAIPPHEEDAPYANLPARVEFRKIIANVMNSLKFLHRENENNTKFDKWVKYLEFQENQAIVSDLFWYSICKFFNHDKFINTENLYLKRIAKHYINFFLSITDKQDNHLFFKTYFDVLAQSVFYAFFYAFPLSRSKFNDQLKKGLLDEFSELMTGIKISNTEMYLSNWNLDLGAGNIFKLEAQQKLEKKRDAQQSLPPIHLSYQVSQQRNKRQLLGIRFSPIVEQYLKNNKYKTRNYIQGFKMKVTEIDKNQEEIEQKFERYRILSEQIMSNSDEMKRDNLSKKNQMDSEIRQIKQQTVKHHRRLEKRKAEELERGAHEYANYLVSMLNAGITIANLGVSNNNTK